MCCYICYAAMRFKHVYHNTVLLMNTIHNTHLYFCLYLKYINTFKIIIYIYIIYTYIPCVSMWSTSFEPSLSIILRYLIYTGGFHWQVGFPEETSSADIAMSNRNKLAWDSPKLSLAICC